MQKDFYLAEGGGADGYDGSESGVEPDYAESLFDSEEASDILFDMSDEQVMAALRYFTSTAQRTNMLTKTHSNDLEIIAQLLSDKEKDLEMTAKIGQSLLQRNKQLLVKIESMEDYLNTTTENANQLQHDLQLKSKLVEFYTMDDDIHSTSSGGSKGDRSIDDEEIVKLTNRCKKLEKDNQTLFSEALGLKQMTDEMEEKEESLVLDCIEQLASAKLQITQLTDEIALKFEDNLQQQMEISQLINMVVELQRKQKMLMDENGELIKQLTQSNENRESLQEQLHEMQLKFRETKQLMVENQEEIKALKSGLYSADNPCDWLSDSGHSLTLPLTLQDSLATEIEETVRRDLRSSLAFETSKAQNKRLLDNVRHLNVKGSDTTSGRTSPASLWSLASDERSDSLLDLDNRVRKPTRKLQIVKPMEGSDTLNKWHHLASKNIKGGLDVTSEESHSPVENTESNSIEDTNISVIHHDRDSPRSASTTDAGSDNDTTLNPQQDSPRLKKTSSPREKPAVRPRPKPRPRVLSDLSTPQKKTIITRNSAVLKSIRKGRSLLNSDQKDGRSQAEVIDMIAAAMGKVNVESATEERILSSLNVPPGQERETNTPLLRADYTDMPNVAKMLNKAAQLNEVEKESGHLLKSEYRKASAVSEHSTMTYDSGGEATGTSNVGHKSTSSTTTRMSVDSNLRSITGPLGLLNRATKSSEPLRYSVGGDFASILDSRLDDVGNTTILPVESVLDLGSGNSTLPHPNTDSSEVTNNNKNNNNNNDDVSVTSSVGTTLTGGSLLGIMTSSRLKSRPMGLGNLVTLDSTSIELPLDDTGGDPTLDDDEELDIDVDDKTRTKATDTAATTRSSETEVSSVKKEGTAGLFGFFSSFLS